MLPRATGSRCTWKQCYWLGTPRAGRLAKAEQLAFSDAMVLAGCSLVGTQGHLQGVLKGVVRRQEFIS